MITRIVGIPLLLLLTYSGTHALLFEMSNPNVGKILGCYTPSIMLLVAVIMSMISEKESRLKDNAEDSG